MNTPANPLDLLLHFLEPGLTCEAQHALLQDLDANGWAALVSEAQRQDVEPILYLLLFRLKEACGFSAPLLDSLRNAYLTSAGGNALALHDAEEAIRALQNAGVQTAGLKGIYLLEGVYGDIGARAMTDIDLLVRKADLPAALQALQGLGYTPVTYFNLGDANIDVKHVPPMTLGEGPPVEVHWTLLEEDEPFTIDAEALWQRVLPAAIADVDALALGVEDLVLHLGLHLTYQHYLRLGLRGLYDIALVIHKFREEIDWQELVRIARSWQAEKVTALTLKLVETQLCTPVPPEVFAALLPEGPDLQVLADARSQLLERERYADYFTPDLAELAEMGGFFSKVRRGFQRLFIPRLALARIYGVPPNSPRIWGCYFRRLRYLLKQYGRTLFKIGAHDTSLDPALKRAEASNALHAWLTQRD